MTFTPYILTCIVKYRIVKHYDYLSSAWVYNHFEEKMQLTAVIKGADISESKKLVAEHFYEVIKNKFGCISFYIPIIKKNKDTDFKIIEDKEIKSSSDLISLIKVADEKDIANIVFSNAKDIYFKDKDKLEDVI